MLVTKKVPTIIANGDTVTGYIVTTIQSNIKKAVDSILGVPLLDQNLFQALSVKGGTAFTVNHGLQRAYVGYFITRIQGSNQITLREVTPAMATMMLTLIPSATGTIDLVVF